MFLFAGLGNPGTQYAKTRHNAGFIIIDHLADLLKCPSYQAKFKSYFTSINADIPKAADTQIALMKPQTFMNSSGVAVGDAARFYKLPANQVFVIYDDKDLSFGKVKIKNGGGSGGHNGIKSLDQYLGTEYHRIRFGVGSPHPAQDTASWVLSNFTKSELEVVEDFAVCFYQNLTELFSNRFDVFLNNWTIYQEKTKKN